MREDGGARRGEEWTEEQEEKEMTEDRDDEGEE